MFGRVHCQVVETPTQGYRAASGGEWPRDLLPWADPYIALLMTRLADRYEVDEASFERPLPAEAASWEVAYDDSWQDDAFMPWRNDAPRRPIYPPVFGGFPLLDDVTDGLEEEPC